MQRSRIDTITQAHLTQDTIWENEKKTKKNDKTSHTREPRGQPLPQRCKEQIRQYDKDKHDTEITRGSTKQAPTWNGQ